MQRMRWFSGAYQCKKYYFKQLLKKHSFPCVDMALVFGSVYFMVLGLLPLIMSAVSMIVYMAHTPEYVLPMLLLAAGSGLLSIHAMQAFAILICLLERKRLKPDGAGDRAVSAVYGAVDAGELGEHPVRPAEVEGHSA